MIDVGKIEKLMVLMAHYGVDVVQAESGPEKISLAKNAAQFGFFVPASRDLNSALASQNSAAAGSQGSAIGHSSSGSSGGAHGQDSSSASSGSHSSSGFDKTSGAGGAGSGQAAKIPDGVQVNSPFVGTFYRSPSPDSPVFVDIGSRVRKGQSLCIVEAMKLMNEIECEVDGEIVAILAENGKSVEFGTPLFVIKP